MNDADLENELVALSKSELRRRIDDMEEVIADPTTSAILKLGAEEYLPKLKLELESR